uniref:CCHC-type domain-containing protein n=1 Tax=Cajanus cajan TaxID=3821 RepID=A0A151RZ73_CAJCA|nr:hypothetical protein KK1_030490 [Cajanus cajan]
MKVKQLFSCHGVIEERKVSLTTFSFQGHAMYWWTSLEKKKKKEKEKEKEKSSLKTSSKESRSGDIKCFKCLGRGHIASQCPTNKTMILKGQDHYNSLDEANSSSSTSNSEEEILPCEGDLLMVRRLLGNQSSEIDQSQRENLFHTRYKVLENNCSLIVDSGSSCNCCSTRLVEKLALTTKPHPKP